MARQTWGRKFRARILMLLVKYSHNLVMKTKRKKSSAAAETVAPKKGRPAKVYTIEDAVRMVSIRDERRVQSSSWWNAKTRNLFAGDLYILLSLLHKFCTGYFSRRLCSVNSPKKKQFELAALRLSNFHCLLSDTTSVRDETWKKRRESFRTSKRKTRRTTVQV